MSDDDDGRIYVKEENLTRPPPSLFNMVFGILGVIMIILFVIILILNRDNSSLFIFGSALGFIIFLICLIRHLINMYGHYDWREYLFNDVVEACKLTDITKIRYDIPGKDRHVDVNTSDLAKITDLNVIDQQQ